MEVQHLAPFPKGYRLVVCKKEQVKKALSYGDKSRKHLLSSFEEES